MKKPSVDRGPKLNRAMAQPQTMMTSGVRQLGTGEATLWSLMVTDIGLSLAACSRKTHGPRDLGQGIWTTGLMHSHGNPNWRRAENSLRIAALQIGAVSP